jgi:hypothetical protein
MRALKTIAVAAVLGIAATGAATAAETCSQKAFAGVWVLTVTTPQLCLVEINSKGAFSESRCYLPGDFENPLGSLSGTVLVSSACKVTGEVTQKVGKKSATFKIKATATVTPDGGVIVGTAKSGDGSVRLAAFQQW